MVGPVIFSFWLANERHLKIHLHTRSVYYVQKIK